MFLVRLLVMVIILVTAFSANALAQADSGKFSGLMFGDYYYIISNHKSEIEGLSGFWFRRIYLTYDKGLSDAFSTRLRLEAQSAGDFESADRIEPFMKDAYLKWKSGETQVLFGLSPAPTWGYNVEKTWGYRSLEKTPLDLYRMGSSRDFGVAVKGSLAAKKLGYHLMAGNGASTRSETDADKTVSGAVAVYPSAELLIEIYGDWMSHPGDTDWYTAQVFASYAGEGGRVGFLYAHQIRKVAGSDDVTLKVASLYAVVKTGNILNLVGRVDRMFDPNPDGNRIPFIPFDTTTPYTFLLGGLDFVHRESNVHLLPNVEAVLYDENDSGVTPVTDVIGRMTVFWTF